MTPEETEAVEDSRTLSFAHARNISNEVPLLRFLNCRLQEPKDGDPVVVVQMPITHDVQNKMGTPHGGALAALADHAGGLAAMLLTGRGGPTADLHIRFLGTSTAGAVTAESRLLRDGRRLIVTEVRMFDDQRTLIATATVSTVPRLSDDRSAE